MSVAKITERTASRLSPGETTWDDTVKGFGIRRQRTAAVYVFKYRQGGKQRFKTIGRHGSPWTAEMARDTARRYQLGLLEGRRVGDDIAGTVPSLAQFAERYMVQHAAGRKKPGTLAEDRRNLDRHILPALGVLRLDQITRSDVAGFHAALAARPVAANRCLSLLSHIFTVAEKWDLRPTGTNPCRGLDRYPERRRERWLDAEELRRLGAVLDRCERAGGTGHGSLVDWRVVACIRLLILTGARLGEIQGLQWSWINWERGYARLPDSKTGPKTIPLPPPALALLTAIQEQHHSLAVRKHVLPSGRLNAPFRGIQKPWQRVRKMAGVPDLRIHDLRHCYASFAVAGGESLYMVGAILGHRTSKTTERYAHLAHDTIGLAAGRTAGRLAQLMGSSQGVTLDDHGAAQVQRGGYTSRPPGLGASAPASVAAE